MATITRIGPRDVSRLQLVKGSGKPRARANKFHAQPEWVNGVRFDSRKEAMRYRELLLLERIGHVGDIVLQPKFPLTCGGKPVLLKSTRYPNGRRASYRADFQYRDKLTGYTVVEDVKGMDTPLSRLKRAIVAAEHGVEIFII